MAVLPASALQMLIDQHNWAALREFLEDWPVADIGDVLMEMDKTRRMLLFRALPRDMGARVFSYLDEADQDRLLRDLTDEEARHLISTMAPDDRVALLEELPGRATQKILNLLSPEDLKEVRNLLGYPEESVGRLMTPDYVAVRPNWTVAQTIQHLRKMGRTAETINRVYVTDARWKLTGEVSLRQIVLADPDETIDKLARDAVSISATEDREEAARVMKRYDLFVLPVVDSDGVLEGIVTGDDVIDVAMEETTEDFHKVAAVAPVKVGFKDAGISLLYRSRIGWLAVLVLVDIVSGQIMARFEGVISAVVPLVFFLPLLIGCGGNAGSQSSALIVRALAVERVERRDWLGLLLTEIGVSTALGLTMGIAVLGPSLLRGGAGVGAVVATSMVVIVLMGSMTGMLFPLVLERLGFDPAAASSPLVTSVADIFGVAVYFTIARHILGI